MLHFVIDLFDNVNYTWISFHNTRNSQIGDDSQTKHVKIENFVCMLNRTNIDCVLKKQLKIILYLSTNFLSTKGTGVCKSTKRDNMTVSQNTLSYK